MKQLNVAYIGLDLHATQSEFGVIDGQGQVQQRHKLATDPKLMNDFGAETACRRAVMPRREAYGAKPSN